MVTLPEHMLQALQETGFVSCKQLRVTLVAGRGKVVFALQAFVKKRKERKEPKKFTLKEQPQDFIRRKKLHELQQTSVTS